MSLPRNYWLMSQSFETPGFKPAYVISQAPPKFRAGAERFQIPQDQN